VLVHRPFVPLLPARPPEFRAVGQFYEDFTQVEDEQVVALLREFAPAPQAAEATA
jgi:predicted phosphoribosyltransferase